MLMPRRAAGGRDAESDGGRSGGGGAPAAAGEPCLVVQPWWAEHLEAAAGGGGAGRGGQPEPLPGPAGWPPPDADAAGARTLRWIYGAVVNAAAAEVGAPPGACPAGIGLDLTPPVAARAGHGAWQGSGRACRPRAQAPVFG